ncbi:MAG: hypothetical protein HY331_10900 [Chloroflexi bacterium]|nr:hypothetical protein [Chloroflexota bacterium]
MDLFVVTSRLVHISTGIYWVGAALVIAGFITPAVEAAGPEGGRFMQRLAQTRLPFSISLSSVLSALSGIVLYWWASAGLQGGWITSGRGLGFTLAGLVGILAASLGFAVSAPTAQRIAALGKEIQAAGGPPKPAQLQQMRALQQRIKQAGVLAAALLVVTVVGMVIAPYL